MISDSELPGSLPLVDLSAASGAQVGTGNFQLNLGLPDSGPESFGVSVAPPLPLHLRDPKRKLRGRDELVEQLVELIDDFKGKATATGGSASSLDRRGQQVLLYGPGGCGKTSVAEQVAHEVALRGGERGVKVDVWWVNAVEPRGGRGRNACSG